MKDLQELIKIINPQKIKNLTIIGGKNSKLRKLYNKLYKEANYSEKEAIKRFFPKAGNPKQAFADLKNALKNELLKTLFLIRIDQGFSAYQRAYFLCYRDYAIFKILLALLAKNTAIKIGNKLLKRTLKFEFTELSLSIARDLLLYFSMTKSDIKEFNYYSPIIEEQKRHLEKEILLERDYIALEMSLAKKQPLTGLVEAFFESTSLTKENLSFKETYKVIFYAFCNLVTHQEVLANSNQAIAYCEQAIETLQQKTYPLPVTPYLFFYSKSIPHCLQTQNWEKGSQLIGDCLELLPRKSYNYHAFLFYQVMLAFHSGNYQLAYEALKKHKKSTLNSQKMIEQWKMAEAWVALFIGWKKIEAEGIPRSFKVFKFINETPNFAKDKSGNNAAIQIIKFLLLFQRENFNKIFDTTQALKIYSYRYLRNARTMRTYAMIRTLCAIADTSFDKAIAREKCQPYYERLKANPLNFLEQRTVEIVPFELLVEEVLNRL